MRKCAICGKTSRMAGTRILLRGHYNPTNWSRKYPNLQLTRTPEGERVLACAQCIRTFGKTTRMEKKKTDRDAKKAADLPAPGGSPKKGEKKPEVKKESKPKKESKKAAK